jgi:hypothetical protein
VPFFDFAGKHCVLPSPFMSKFAASPGYLPATRSRSFMQKRIAASLLQHR